MGDFEFAKGNEKSGKKMTDWWWWWSFKLSFNKILTFCVLDPVTYLDGRLELSLGFGVLGCGGGGRGKVVGEAGGRGVCLDWQLWRKGEVGGSLDSRFRHGPLRH